jgi:uncharacterized damage-inducible protein DinB
VTEWTDLDAVKEFAGQDYDKAKYYPFDDNMLLEFEEYVQHYETNNVSNQKIQLYIEQLQRLYHGGNWVGESFEGKLKDLKEDEVYLQPLPDVHSVAEVVWHCIYWRTVTIHRLQGDGNRYRDATAEKLNFLGKEELKAKGWSALKKELAETQTVLIDLLKTETDPFLNKEYQPGYSFDFLIEGTIQHDYYHLGQIGLILKMLSLKA